MAVSLLKIDQGTSERFRCFVHRHLTGMKPGWIRLSLPYYASEADIEYVLSAVEFIADHGPDLIPAYRFSWANSVWSHIENDVPDECEADCDIDGVPDDCESDCNGNGVPDDCDLADGTDIGPDRIDREGLRVLTACPAGRQGQGDHQDRRDEAGLPQAKVAEEQCSHHKPEADGQR